MNYLTVKCQNCRSKNAADDNGSVETKKNARCQRLLGRIADIDGKKMEAAIDGVIRNVMEERLSQRAGVRIIMSMFCQSFVAGYYCPACRAFMDVQFDNPGYVVDAEPLSLFPKKKTMIPKKIRSVQMEIA